MKFLYLYGVSGLLNTSFRLNLDDIFQLWGQSSINKGLQIVEEIDKVSLVQLKVRCIVITLSTPSQTLLSSWFDLFFISGEIFKMQKQATGLCF